MTSQLLIHDTRDDRREIHTLLARLPPRRRLAFLAFCCSQATLPNSTLHPQVSPKTLALLPAAEHDDEADRRLALECYMDVFYLSAQYNFSLDGALERLVEVVRRQR